MNFGIMINEQINKMENIDETAHGKERPQSKIESWIGPNDADVVTNEVAQRRYIFLSALVTVIHDILMSLNRHNFEQKRMRNDHSNMFKLFTRVIGERIESFHSDLGAPIGATKSVRLHPFCTVKMNSSLDMPAGQSGPDPFKHELFE